MSLDFIKIKIRSMPDFLKPKITFRNITPLLADTQGLRLTTKVMVEDFERKRYKSNYNSRY